MKTVLNTLLIATILSTAVAFTVPLVSNAAEGDPVATKLSDSVITAKVKAEFAADKIVSATDIKVETDSKGLVQLSGKAKTKVEAEKAVSIAKNTKGVTAVKSDIVVTE